MKKAIKIALLFVLASFGYSSHAIHIIDINTTNTVGICINDSIGIRTSCGFSNYVWKDNGLLITGGVDPAFAHNIPYQGDATCMLIVPPPINNFQFWSFNYEVCYDSLGTTVCHTIYVIYNVPDGSHDLPIIGTDVFSCGADTVILHNSTSCPTCVDTWYPGGVDGDFLKVTTSGEYYFEASKANGLSTAAGDCIMRTKPIKVEINPYPVVSSIASQSICDGDVVTLTSLISNGVPVTYAWSGDVGDLSATNILSPVATIASAATRNYKLIVTDKKVTACKDTVDIQIKMATPLVLTLGYEDSTICGSDPINLLVSASGGLPTNGTKYDYNWQRTFPTASAYSALQNPSVQTFVENKFAATVSDSIGCSTISNIVTVSVSDLNISSPNDSAQICADDSIQLTINGTGGEGNLTYNWTPTLDLSNANQNSTWCYAQSPTNYIGRVTDTVGCYREFPIHINAISLPFIDILNPDATICMGIPVDIMARALGGSGSGYTFTWDVVPFFSVSKDSISSVVSVSDSLSKAIFTKYEEVSVNVTVSVVDDLGCESSNVAFGQVRFEGVEAPTAEITTNSSLIFEGDVVNFNSNSNNYDSIYWIVKDEMSDLGNLNIQTSYADSGTYPIIVKVVKLTDPNGFEVACSLYDTLGVHILYKAIPLAHNVFTPNNDNVNETFWIDFLDFYGENELVLFNRWGNELHRITNYQNDWTGEGLPDGTYFYHFTAEGDSKSPHKGSFMIIR